MPLEAHIKEHPAYFHRFDSAWTPTAIILDLDQAYAIQRLCFPALRGQLETLEDALIPFVTWLEEQWVQQGRDFDEWRRQFSSKAGIPLEDAYNEAYHEAVNAIVKTAPLG